MEPPNLGHPFAFMGDAWRQHPAYIAGPPMPAQHFLMAHPQQQATPQQQHAHYQQQQQQLAVAAEHQRQQMLAMNGALLAQQQSQQIQQTQQTQHSTTHFNQLPGAQTSLNGEPKPQDIFQQLSSVSSVSNSLPTTSTMSIHSPANSQASTSGSMSTGNGFQHPGPPMLPAMPTMPYYSMEAIYQYNNIPPPIMYPMGPSAVPSPMPSPMPYSPSIMAASPLAHPGASPLTHLPIPSLPIPPQGPWSTPGTSAVPSAAASAPTVTYLDHRQTLVLHNSTIDTISMSSSSSESSHEFGTDSSEPPVNLARQSEINMLTRCNLSRKKYNRLKRKSEVITVSGGSSKKVFANDAIEVLKNVDPSTFENDTRTQIFYKNLIERILYGKFSDIPPEIRETLSSEDIQTIEKIKKGDRETLTKLLNEFNNKSTPHPQSSGSSASTQEGLKKAPKKAEDIVDKFLHSDNENEGVLRERLLLQIIRSKENILAKPEVSNRWQLTPIQQLLKDEGMLNKMREDRTKKSNVKRIDGRKLAAQRNKVSKYQSTLHILRSKSKLTEECIKKDSEEILALQKQLDICRQRIEGAELRKKAYDRDILELNPVAAEHEKDLKAMFELLKNQNNQSPITGEWDSGKFIKNPLNLHTTLNDLEFFRMCAFAFVKPAHSIKRFSEIKFCDRYEKMFRNTLRLPNRKFETSMLEHFKFYRLSKDCKAGMFGDQWSNSINPQQILCRYELKSGQCNDQTCLYQHQKDFSLTEEEKLVDLYSYFKMLRNELNYENLINNPKAEIGAFLKKIKTKFNVVDSLKDKAFMEKIEGFVRRLAKEGSLVESFIIRPFPVEVFKHTDMKRDCAFLQEYEYRFNPTDETFILRSNKYFRPSGFDAATSFSWRFFSQSEPVKEELTEILKLKGKMRIFRILKLSYSFMVEQFNNGIVNAIDNGLLVLKKAYDFGVKDADICTHYLRFYRQKLRINVDFNLRQRLVPFDVFAKNLLKALPYYNVWIVYLKYFEKYDEKVEIVDQIIETFVAGKMLYNGDDKADKGDDKVENGDVKAENGDDKVENGDVKVENGDDKAEKNGQKSKDIVEIILYRIHLFICEENHKDGFDFFKKFFVSIDKKRSILSEALTSQDRVFLWLCFIHYVLFKTLPHECFDHSKQSSFRHLSNLNGFLFDFQYISDHLAITFGEICDLFHDAIKECCPEIDYRTLKCPSSLKEDCGCRALRHNLLELLYVYRSDIDEFRNFLKHDSDLSHVYLDKIFANTLASSFDMVLMEESCIPPESGIELAYMKNYLYAFYYNKFDIPYAAKSYLVKNLFLLFDGLDGLDGSNKQYEEPHDDIYERLFHTVLLDQALQDDVAVKFVELVAKLDPERVERSKNSVHFQLSYIFYTSLLISGNKELKTFKEKSDALDRCFQAFISSIEISKNETNLIFFWIGYMSILLHLKDIGSEEHFCFVYEKLRTICSKFNTTHPNLVYHLVCHFAKFIVKKERIDYFIEMSRFCSLNSSLIMMTLQLSYESQKEKCYGFISDLILMKGVRINLFNFWSIAICLAVDKSDHLNAHKFFQLALLSMPFNRDLIKMMKAYETAVGHDGHLKALHEHCRNNRININNES